MRCIALALIILLFAEGAAMSEKADGDRLDIKTAARIQRDIEKYRKGDAVITVLDKKGRPVEAALIEAEQVTHDFLFGCNIFVFDRFPTAEENAKYKELFKRLLNYATLPFYWRTFEREQGKPGYERVGAMAKWCRENGITTKGHPLMWTHEAGVPTWLPEDEPDEVKRLMAARVREIVSRYKGLIDIWDVVNESTHLRTFADMSVFDYTSEPVRWAREANPKAMLLVNEYGIVDNHPKDAERYFKLLKEMKDAGVPFDAVGIQSHMHYALFAIPDVLKTLDKFAELGKPIHFTETTVLSGKETNPADERRQAGYVEKFYRACFSHPSVRAITWWDFSDAFAWQGVAAGLVRKDLSPKPVYLVLDRLINKQWHTSAQGRTSSDGSYAFRGFHGKYRLTITTPSGASRTVDFHLREDGKNRVKVSM